jgi:translation initiation factor IF-2
MAESTKPVRLSKVAREFNLGMTTVVDFLASKGIEVEAKPNTKLDPATYALVRSNFQGDKETKQKAQRSATGIQERESITLASAKKRTAVKQEEEEPEIDLSQFRKSEAAPVVKRTKPAEAAPVTPPAPKKAEVAPKPEAPVAPKAAAPAAEPVKPAGEAADKPAEKGVKVVGKVDLEALKPKKKAPAKAEAKKEEAVAKAAPEPAAEASQPCCA